MLVMDKKDVIYVCIYTHINIRVCIHFTDLSISLSLLWHHYRLVTGREPVAQVFSLISPSFLEVWVSFSFFLKIFFFFFWCGPFLKSLLNLLQYCFCFMFLFFSPQCIWGLSSLTRDQTLSPCIGRRSLTTGLSGRSLPTLPGIYYFPNRCSI